MRKKIAFGAFLLFFVFAALTTCQLQLNRLSNTLAVRVLVPSNATAKAGNMAAAAAGSKSIVNGSSLMVQITEEATAGTKAQTIALSGQASVDFTFSLSAAGTYDVLAQMSDAVGNIVSEASANFSVPANYPIVLTMYSSLLLDAVLSDQGGVRPLGTGFSPLAFAYSASINIPPVTLTLTPVDPGATIAVTENIGGTEYVDSGTGSVYTLQFNGALDTVTITVTGQDGTVQTYTIDLNIS